MSASTPSLKAVCIYCGSSFGTKPAYLHAAQAMGRTLAERGIELVYGGGNVGLMGAAADAALVAGGRVLGVIPERLMQREVGHRGISQLFVVRTMHERKDKMAQLSDGFVALPGGIGTLDELFEMMTWLQLGYHAKPVGVLDVDGYYDKLWAFLRHAVEEGFVRQEQFDQWIVAREPGELLDRMRAFRAVDADRSLARKLQRAPGTP